MKLIKKREYTQKKMVSQSDAEHVKSMKNTRCSW